MRGQAPRPPAASPPTVGAMSDNPETDDSAIRELLQTQKSRFMERVDEAATSAWRRSIIQVMNHLMHNQSRAAALQAANDETRRAFDKAIDDGLADLAYAAGCDLWESTDPESQNTQEEENAETSPVCS